MNEEQMKADAEKVAAAIRATFQKLEDDLIKAAEGLAFRLKQSLHSVHHAEIDAQVAAAQQHIATALDSAQTSLVLGDAPAIDPAITSQATAFEAANADMKTFADTSAAQKAVQVDAAGNVIPQTASEVKGDDESLHANAEPGAADEGKFDDGRV